MGEFWVRVHILSTSGGSDLRLEIGDLFGVDQVGELRLDRLEDAEHGLACSLVEVVDLVEDEHETVETERAGGVTLGLALENDPDLLLIGEEAEQVELVLEQRVKDLRSHLLEERPFEMGGEKRTSERCGPKDVLNIPVFEFGVAGRRGRLPGAGVSRLNRR